MRLLVLACLAASTLAFDSVLFSSSQKIDKTSSVESLLESASPEHPVVFLVNPDFVLAQFSKAAKAYTTHVSTSSVVNAAKAAKATITKFIAEPVYVPDAVYVTPSSSIDGPYKAGSAVYVVSADNWSTLDELSKSVIPSLASKATFVVTASEVVSKQPVRVKRVATEDMRSGRQATKAANSGLKFPLVLPAVNVTGVNAAASTCLFYLEGLTVVGKFDDGKFRASYGLWDDGTDKTGASNLNTWEYDASYVTCQPLPKLEDIKNGANYTSTFRIVIKSGEAATGKEKATVKGTVDMTLSFVTVPSGDWYLETATLNAPVTLDTNSGKVNAVAGPALNIPDLNLYSVFGWSWSCWEAPALFYKTDNDKTVLGISLHGVQIHVYGQNGDEKGGYKNMNFFTRKVESCTGTFSPGSWMGIITALTMASIFIFGFIMLNSITTGDRFDDPKQRQIVINVRE